MTTTSAPQDLPKEAADLARRAAEVLRRIEDAGLAVATAESCTGGLLASLLTDIEGLSSTFECGFVTYSEGAKGKMLGVDPGLIDSHGVVSQEVARAMAEGAILCSAATISVGITGFAGEAGKGDEPGLVHLAVAREGRPTIVRECHFGNVGRDRVRAMAAGTALEMLVEAIEEK